MEKITAQGLYAQLYDVRVPDWQGEVDFYRALIADSSLKAQSVLEVACGTGRITIQLAKEGVDITGLDLSPGLLEIARKKSIGMSNVNRVLDDMRTFEIGKRFGHVILPGHSFQFMNTPDEQVKCLAQIKRHLVPDGLVVIHLDHQDFGWLAGLLKKEPVCEQGQILVLPTTSRTFRQSFAWAFEPSTQTATVKSTWEEIDETGNVIQNWEMEPMRLHCVFRFEMEHLLNRVGFSIEAVYGDFFKGELTNDSGQMIWLARNKAN
jgi:ubiquinone/menaquinone biosynthesis C-methylase UbiE